MFPLLLLYLLYMLNKVRGIYLTSVLSKNTEGPSFSRNLLVLKSLSFTKAHASVKILFNNLVYLFIF
jgi:hypothetical protein